MSVMGIGHIRVGVDVGTHSVGMSTIRVDDHGMPVEILSGMSLIHDAGIGEDGKKTASTRRELSGVARRARRLLRRRRRRLERLDQLLKELGYPMADASEQSDPYLPWRVREQLVEEYLPDETRKLAISIALRHIARHRGWRNPYAKPESLLSEEIPESDFMAAMRERVTGEVGVVFDERMTPGQVMAKTALSPKVTMRGVKGVLGKLHQSDNAYEIRRICQVQRVPGEECRRLILAVFAAGSPRGSAVSRVAKDPLPGQGVHRRAPKCDPVFQHFRIVSIIANLRVVQGGSERVLTVDERTTVFQFLSTTRSDDLSWVDVAELLQVERHQLRGTAKLTADGERAAARPPVDMTDKTMRGCTIRELRAWWNGADVQQRAAMVRYLYEGEEDSECANIIAGLSEDDQAKLESLDLPAGRAAYSSDSLSRLTERMLTSEDDLHAARKNVFGVDDSWAPPAEAIGAPVGNPSVDRTLKAVARYLRAVEATWGVPESVQVEHVRAGFSSEKMAREIDRANERRYKQNQKTVAEIQQLYGVQGEVRRSDVMRYSAIVLQDCVCVYCGGTIDYRTAQLDHIVPQAGLGSNNRRENLVAVCERCNRAKSNTIFAVWAQNAGMEGVGVAEAVGRVRAWRNRPAGMTVGELNRLKKDVIARLKRTQEDPELDARSMESVAWMANELHHRIAAAYPDTSVKVYKGSITAAARRAAGVDAKVNLIGERGRKDRTDRRHHAVDAAVIALMDDRAAVTLAERSNIRWSQMLARAHEDWKGYTGRTAAAREHFEQWQQRMVRLIELLNLALADDEIHVLENVRLRLGSSKAHDDTISAFTKHRLGDGLTVQQIDRAATPALWCALTREDDFDPRNGLPAREDRVIRVHGKPITSADDVLLFSKKKGKDPAETPFAAIAVRGGFAEIGSTIHHARIYRIGGKKPVYAMVRVFLADLLKHRSEDLFQVPLPPQSISMRCAESKLRTAIQQGTATYLGWVVTGDELEIPMESFTEDMIGAFLQEYPGTTRWRIRGFESNTKIRLGPRNLSSEGLVSPPGAVKKLFDKGWRIAIHKLLWQHPTVIRRDALGRPRWHSSAGLPVSWTIQ